MKKSLGFMLLVVLMLALAACGNDNDDAANNKEEKATTETTTETEKTTEEAALPDSHLQEPQEDTTCEMCNMKVYEKDSDMGMFSAQAVKADGTNAFYDDIGCLLNAEIKFNENNKKYVRDFNTLEWVLVDDATIVKTDLKTPMNWGYAFFKNKEDAQKFIDKNKDKGYTVVDLESVKAAAKERYEQKMKKQGNGQGMKMNMSENKDMHMQNGQK